MLLPPRYCNCFLSLCCMAQEKDAEIMRLREEVRRLLQNQMSDEVRERLRSLEDENSRLLDELRRLKAAFLELTEVWSAAVVSPRV